MINYSIIQKSQLEGANRLDAEYYQPEYLEFSKRLVSLGGVPLGNLAFITDGQHGYHKVDPNSEIRHITAKNIASWLVNDENVDMLSKETNDKNKRSILQEGDLLLSTAGTIGPVGLVTIEVLPANIDQDVARIDINDKNYLNEYYALAFLNSLYGQFQIVRQTTGQIQTHISLDKIKKLILIPIPEWQAKISVIVKLSLNKLSESIEFYARAENLLLEELGLNDSKLEDDLSYIVNFSDVKTANRMDAEYFQPKFDRLISKLKTQDIKSLPKIVENTPAVFNPLGQPEQIFKYVELSNINSSIGVIDGYSEVLGKEAPSRAKRMLKTGDVIVSSIEGALEKVALVDKEQEGYLASTGFFQFRSQEILPEALLVLSKSLVVQMQLKKQCAGTILTAVSKDSLSEMMIPMIPKSTQQKIADLVKKSHEARRKSKELLEEAKRKVEEMIEKGGDKNGYETVTK